VLDLVAQRSPIGKQTAKSDLWFLPFAFAFRDSMSGFIGMLVLTVLLVLLLAVAARAMFGD
jgi:hypothetical protein